MVKRKQQKCEMDFAQAFEAAARESFKKLVEETKMLKSYLVFGDGNGGCVEVPYDELDEYLEKNKGMYHPPVNL